MTFNELFSNVDILKSLQDLGYDSPTPIQQKAIPLIMEGKDVRASSKTGSGKTAAFTLPALVRLLEGKEKKEKGIKILILVPTRELALQVSQEAVKFTKYLPQVKTVCIYGGAPYPPQIRQLQKPFDILVATPGRLMDHMQKERIDLSHLKLLVLDEADRMLDMGFIDDVEQIAEATPEDRQTVLFSATLKGPVLKLSQHLMKDPVEIEVVHSNEELTKIEQKICRVNNIDHKYKLINHFLAQPDVSQMIIFTSTKQQADVLADLLKDAGESVCSLHGGMRQEKRTKTIMRLRQGKIKALVATDVAARGIDIPAISHVINFDLPFQIEDYVHRIGRTGRAGASGVAISLVSNRDLPLVKQIEKFTKRMIPTVIVEGLEFKEEKKKPSVAPKPYKKPSFNADKEPFPRKPFSKPKTVEKKKSASFGHPKPFANKKKYDKGPSDSPKYFPRDTKKKQTKRF
ncbi:MAG: DEAD/DEAH box helicase [Rhabdochlamydiaceae bacterium]